MKSPKILLLTIITIAICSVCNATIFYVDPVTGNMSNNGSYNSPWSTLKDVIFGNKIESQKWSTHPVDSNSNLIPKNAGAPVKAGDTLMLRAGYHGAVTITEYINSDYITIMPQSGHAPILTQLIMNSCRKWKIQNLNVGADADSNNVVRDVLIKVESPGWTGKSLHCIIEDCYLYSIQNATAWTMQQWDTMTCDGIWVRADSITILNNHMKNVNFGISVVGNNSAIQNNVIENFAGDGMRGIGNDLLFEYNTVKNCYAVNANHDDGFQSWSVGTDPPRERVTLRGNIFINYEDSLQPFRGTLQGIGCFDGWYIDWVIENNVVITDHWHGISLYGAINCNVINNTVIDRNPTQSPGPPWIMINKHKNGTSSTGCVVRNNIATAYTLDTTGASYTYDHNLKINTAQYSQLFIDHNNYDLHLNSGCIAIDAGIATLAPTIDADNTPRPFGTAHDLGAYEYWYSTVGMGKGFIENPFKLYPNPNNGNFFIESTSPSIFVEVIDVVGQIIYSETLKGEGLHELNIIEKGIYIVRANNNLEIRTARLLVQ